MQSLFYVLFFLPDCSQRVKSPGSHFPSLFIAHLHSLELLSCSCVMFPLFYGFESLVFLLSQMITVIPLESVACRLVALIFFEPIYSIKKTNSCTYMGIFWNKALSGTLPQSCEWGGTPSTVNSEETTNERKCDMSVAMKLVTGRAQLSP